MAKKRKAPAKKGVTRKPAHKRRAESPDTVVNTLVVLVVIVLALGGLYFYAQNKRQMALFPAIFQSVVALITPAPTGSPPTVEPEAQPTALFSGLYRALVALIAPVPTASTPTAQPYGQPTALIESPSEPLAPIATPAPSTAASPEITGSVQTSQTTASAKARRAATKAVRPTPATEARPSTPIAVVPSENH